MFYVKNIRTHQDEEVGSYGKKWLAFMEQHYKGKVEKMLTDGNYYDVARSVDESAWEYHDLLERQYQEAHPRPKGFENIVAWERTRGFYVDGEVMRSKVLVAMTTV